MSEVKVGKLDYSHPRTIWTLGIQLMYTIIAMIPLYYYMIEILTIRSEARDFVIYSPIFVAIILFFLQLKLNSYFWTSEKTFVKRDITITSSKSAFTIVLEFYLIFLFIFG
ncbi:MAG: hypothetical protein IH840_09265, partial [Candidatus Heimdallarchaeota archaeon]|nr:hypothetical protein [Candidatus Heimdallarchaeota archaeon]